MDKIIILDDMAYMRYRIKDILNSKDIEVLEAGNSFEFFNKLSDNKNDIKLIILEVGLVSEDGFEIIRKIKARDLNIPIMILTKLNTRTVFIKCIKEGICEYILKPFDTKVLVKRIKDIIKSYENNNHEEIIYTNFQEYISKQISRCRDENKELSIIMSSLVKSKINNTEEKIEVNDRYLILMERVYENLRSLFNIPDLFEKNGLSTFISVIPDCSKMRALQRANDMRAIYNDIKANDFQYEEYQFICSSVTFPEDGQDKKQLMDTLSYSMKYKINNINKM